MAAFDTAPVAPAAAPFDMAPQVPEVPPITYRRFDDIAGQRQDIYNYAKSFHEGMRPIENASHVLELEDVGYDDEDTWKPSTSDEKKALLQQASLHRPLRATLKLVDKETGKILDKQRTTLANIPHLNSRGLFTRKGVVWNLRNQTRLRPGIYARKRKSGESEAHFNVKNGRGFRLMLEPDSGLFKMQIGQSTTRLYPLLRKMGVPDEEIKEAWGEKLFNKNFRPASPKDTQELRKVVTKLGNGRLEIDDDQLVQGLKDILARNEIDEDTAEITMGERFKHLSPERLLQVSDKVLKVSKGESKEDNRDSQAFQSFHSAEDMIKERLKRDQSGVLRKLLWKASREGKLGNLQSGMLDKNIGSLFQGSGIGQVVEDINPFEIYDMRQAVTRMGDGGISSEQAVSRDARGVQASYLGVIDAGRGPESSKLGLDLRLTDAALKGSDGQLYTTVRNTQTGEPEIVSARTLSTKTVAFPGELAKDGKRVIAMRDDQIQYVPRDEVDFEIQSANDMMSRATAMIPFPQSLKGQRLLMGARMTAQAMPLREAEAPLVQTGMPDGRSMHDEMGRFLGAAYAPEVGGTVTKVTPDFVEVQTPNGEKKRVDLYNNYPTARKTSIHSSPVVSPGDVVAPGQLVARSNFTDDRGTAAIGRNLRVGFVAAEGATLEDAFVISESTAKKLTSEAMYKTRVDRKDIETDRERFRNVYGDKFEPEQYEKLDEDGVIQEGAEVLPGDPLVLGMNEKGKRAVGAVMRSDRSSWTDKSQTWKHNAPGVVTDVVKTPRGISVVVKSYDMMRKADKLSARHGGKGVISEIRPDSQMPVAADGKPLEVLANSLGIVSRVNPSYLAEALLGKVAEKTGKPYTIKGFEGDDVAQFALDEAVKHGVATVDEEGNIKDTETVTDPRDGREIPNVFTGNAYFMKLHHMAESKLSARDQAGYTTEGLPAKGGKEGSKRIGVLDAYSLVAAGAHEFLKDAKLVRGQRNDDFWRAVREGDTPLATTSSFANDAFKDQLRAAGVKLREKGSRTGLAPLLDRDVDELAQHEISNPGTFDFNTMEPIKGGLFDVSTTGGAEGNRFAKITLPVKIPHPLFVEPIQRLLGMTGKQFEAVMKGEEEIDGKTGADAIEHGLSRVDVEGAIKDSINVIKSGKKSKRDEAVKKLNYLAGLKKMGIAPSELMVSKIPVIPPKYRPISQARDMDMIHDLNYLYTDMLEARKNYDEASKVFGSAGEEYNTLFETARAIAGTREAVNPKTAEQGVKGILRYAIGMGDTPKYGGYQRKVLGASVDNVGRGTITADPDMDMDEVSIPKELAWKVYRPFVIRRMRRLGYGAKEAVQMVKKQDPVATEQLKDEMSERPVVYNRAPALHRYNYVSGFAKLRDDDAIGMSPHVLKGMNADFDGDQVNIHVPVSAPAVEEAKEKLLPSNNLLHSATFESHIEPMQDYLAGLYLATRPDDKQKVVTFDNAEAAKEAYQRGEISARTPIRILKS